MPKNKILDYAGIGSAVMLAGLPVFFTLGPVFRAANVSAEEAAGESGGSAMALSVGSALALTAQDVSISATPTVGNSFITATSTVKVTNTGSSGGYHLVMSSNNGGALKNGEKAVNTFTGYEKTGRAMKNGEVSSWGYTMQNVKGTNAIPVVNNGEDLSKTYYPIPVANVNGSGGTSWGETADSEAGRYAYLKNTTDYTDQVNGDDIVVGYGFAIGPSTAAGTYTDTITYTAVANKDNRTILDSKITTMQDLAKYPEACMNTPTPAPTDGNDAIPTKVLKDSRDNSEYTVKKLADGNCWMTDSLKIAGIDASTPRVLTASDSNIKATAKEAGFKLKAPAINGAAELYGTEASKDFVYASGKNGTYLYPFQTASAGNGASLKDGKSTKEDICPKGWHLPDYESTASWKTLLMTIYGLTNDEDGGAKLVTDNIFGLKLTDRLGFPAGELAKEDVGYYWTRTADSDTHAHSLRYGATFMNPDDTGYKCSGRAIRCVSE